MHQLSEQLTELARKINGARPRTDVVSQKIAVSLYRLLSEGHPVPLTQLARVVSIPLDDLTNILEPWPVFFDDQRAVVGFGGLTVMEMPPHRFVVEGRTLYTWCAWDGLFIPGILGKSADITSRDPVTRAPITLMVTPEGVSRAQPQSTVISFLTPDRTFGRDVIANFCHFVHFFSSRETGETWTAQNRGTFLLSVEDAFALGQLTNVQGLRDVLGSQARATRG